MERHEKGPDYESAWRELHDHLSWMQANRALGAEYIGRNFADIATRLLKRAYPGLCEGEVDALSRHQWQPIEKVPAELKQPGQAIIIRNMNAGQRPMFGTVSYFSMVHGKWLWVSCETGYPVRIEQGAEFLDYRPIHERSRRE